MMRFTAYILLSASCTSCVCDGVEVSIRRYADGSHTIAGISACAGAEMEINEALFNTLMQTYIHTHGSTPPLYEDCRE